MSDRRRFMAKTGGMVAAAAAATIGDAPTIIAQPKASGACRPPGRRCSTIFRAQPSGSIPGWQRADEEERWTNS